ncbi:MAG: hypothetical protein Q9191_000760 [Dirinaria sp. TL-2023a]
MASQTPLDKAEIAAIKEDPAVPGLIDALKEHLPSSASSQAYDRQRLREAALELALALESPGETFDRVAYYIVNFQVLGAGATEFFTLLRTLDENSENPVNKEDWLSSYVKMDRLKLLQAIVNSPSPQSSAGLAQAAGADPLLLRRLLRFLAATRIIGEVDVDRYEATHITRTLSTPIMEAGINHAYDVVGRPTMALPDFLQRTGYRNPDDGTHCPFQDAFRTEDSLFQWFPKNPEDLQTFNFWLTKQREGRSSWLDFYPLEENFLKGFSGGDDGVMFVDVGGATGHDIEAIKKRFPRLPGKFILQDLPNTIKQAPAMPGVQAMAHDFFTEQPIKGAKCYYLCNVLHDWPDNHCHSILTRLAAAMTPGYSRLIINEMVIQDKDASLVAVHRDIAMMCVAGAIERTEQQWRDIVGKAGLKVEGIWNEVPEAESVIVLMKD